MKKKAPKKLGKIIVGYATNKKHLMPTKPPHTICGAKTRSGKPCTQRQMPNGRCKMHGGMSLKGLASGTFKTGRYSKYAPTALALKCEEALQDRELLVLRPEIALVGARTQEMVANLGQDAGATRWGKLKDAHGAMEKARQDRDPQRLEQSLIEIGKIINAGADEQRTWDEIAKLLETRRKLVASEMDHMIKMEYVLTAEAAIVLIARIGDIIKRNVTDRTALQNISTELGRIVDIGSAKILGPPVGAGEG